MGAADREPTALLGVGALLPMTSCAEAAEELRSSPSPRLRAFAATCYAVATDYTHRQLRTSVAGSSAMATAAEAMPPSDRPAALSTQEAAARLGVSSRRVRQLIAAGKLPGSWQDANGSWWVPQAAADRRARDGERGGARAAARAAS